MENKKMEPTSQKPPSATSWELVGRLFNGQQRKALLGYPPLSKRSIDEVFLFRALTGRLFHTMYDYDNLRKCLLSRGYSDNLVALKILPWTEQGILEAHSRAKRAFQCDYYDDEDDQGTINNRRKKKINVSFMDLIEMTNDSIERFTPEARFRLHNTVYYSTGDSPDEASTHGNDKLGFGGTPADVARKSRQGRAIEPCCPC